jgi:hypothetical protein
MLDAVRAVDESAIGEGEHIVGGPGVGLLRAHRAEGMPVASGREIGATGVATHHPGIGAHLAPETVLTFDRNPCSP